MTAIVIGLLAVLLLVVWLVFEPSSTGAWVALFALIAYVGRSLTVASRLDVRR